MDQHLSQMIVDNEIAYKIAIESPKSSVTSQINHKITSFFSFSSLFIILNIVIFNGDRDVCINFVAVLFDFVYKYRMRLYRYRRIYLPH